MGPNSAEKKENQVLLEEKTNIKESMQEQKNILYLSYLSILGRVENQDLDNLFDGDIELGQEEMLAIYGLIMIINGAHSFSEIVPPVKMHSSGLNLGPDQYVDVEYQFKYESYKKNNKIFKRIKSIKAEKTGPFNDSKIIFNYNDNNDIRGIDFERNLSNQKIILERNNNKVTTLLLERDYATDNTLDISYLKNGLPLEVKQKKINLESKIGYDNSDKIRYIYDKGDNLKNILYDPALSLKNLKGKGKLLTKKGGAKKITDFFIQDTLRRAIHTDSIFMKNNSGGLPNSTHAFLNDSFKTWIGNYTEGKAQLKYDTKKRLIKIVTETSRIGEDEKRELTLEYPLEKKIKK